MLMSCGASGNGEWENQIKKCIECVNQRGCIEYSNRTEGENREYIGLALHAMEPVSIPPLSEDRENVRKGC